MGVDEVLAVARAGLVRLTPEQVHADPALLLVDTRTSEQRAEQGDLPGALVIDRTVLEWRLDPASPHRVPEALPGVRVVVVCRQGFSSSLAAASLRAVGVDATDLVGGVEAWVAAGLPLTTAEADVRR